MPLLDKILLRKRSLIETLLAINPKNLAALPVTFYFHRTHVVLVQFLLSLVVLRLTKLRGFKRTGPRS